MNSLKKVLSRYMQQYSMVRNVDQGLKQVKEASSNKGYEAESKAF